MDSARFLLPQGARRVNCATEFGCYGACFTPGDAATGLLSYRRYWQGVSVAIMANYKPDLQGSGQKQDRDDLAALVAADIEDQIVSLLEGDRRRPELGLDEPRSESCVPPSGRASFRGYPIPDRGCSKRFGKLRATCCFGPRQAIEVGNNTVIHCRCRCIGSKRNASRRRPSVSAWISHARTHFVKFHLRGESMFQILRNKWTRQW